MKIGQLLLFLMNELSFSLKGLCSFALLKYGFSSDIIKYRKFNITAAETNIKIPTVIRQGYIRGKNNDIINVDIIHLSKSKESELIL
jgi:hypothetical protein